MIPLGALPRECTSITHTPLSLFDLFDLLHLLDLGDRSNRCNRSNKPNSQSPLSQAFRERKIADTEKRKIVHTESSVITYVR